MAKFEFKITIHYSLWIKCCQLRPFKTYSQPHGMLQFQPIGSYICESNPYAKDRRICFYNNPFHYIPLSKYLLSRVVCDLVIKRAVITILCQSLSLSNDLFLEHHATNLLYKIGISKVA